MRTDVTLPLHTRESLRDIATELDRLRTELSGDIERAKKRGHVALALDLVRFREQVGEARDHLGEVLDATKLRRERALMPSSFTRRKRRNGTA